LATVDSTNAWARRAVRGGALDVGLVHAVTADEQTAGRGRGARGWTSSAADIKLSLFFALPPAAVPRAYLLSALAAVTAARVCGAALAGAAGAAPLVPPLQPQPQPQPALRVGVKWPNDIIAGGWRKVGGILCELESEPGASASGGAPRYWAVVGIGVNVNSLPDALPPRLHWPASTLRAEAGRELDAAALTDALVNGFVEVRRRHSARVPPHAPVWHRLRSSHPPNSSLLLAAAPRHAPRRACTSSWRAASRRFCPTTARCRC
jgi:BirA family biotin operon repressor/biotin-[acetyl-CoA-carboxylase] ligase